MAIYKKIDNNDAKIASNNIIDHSELSGRNAYGAHSIQAIRGLPEKLTKVKNDITDEAISRDNADKDIELNAKRIDLSEGENGTLVFTDYEGNQTTVQGGYLPDDETIDLQDKYDIIALTEETFKPNTYYIVDNNQYVLAETFDENETYYVKQDKLVAIGLDTDEGTLTGNSIQKSLTTLSSMVNAKGGYLNSHNFGTLEPTQQQLTDYALQDIGISDPNEIWDKTRVINLYTTSQHKYNDTWIWDLNSLSWSNLGDVPVINDANNEGLHGLVTGAPDDGDHDYMGNIDINGQININGLPSLANDVEGLKTSKQNTLVSGTNIKTLNGYSILGSGNLAITTYLPFPNSWTTNGTIIELFEDIENDTSAIKGMAYLGEVTCSDLPFVGNADIVIEIMDGEGTEKVIVATINSGTDSPYYWRYTYWVTGATIHTSGWKSFVPTERTINGKPLTSNITLTASDVGALPDDTPIPTVNNSTITITQGGVTKGSFTLNQSSDETIELDTGGAGDYADLENKPFIQTDGRYIEDDTVKTSSGSIAQTGTTLAEDGGWVQPQAEGRGSAAFGRGTVAGGQQDWSNPDNNNHDYAFASGKNSKAYGDSSFVANRGNTVTGANAAGFNESTQAKGKDSFSAGYGSIAYDKGTFATGYYTEAKGEYSFTANSGDTNGKYAFAANEETRANAEAASSFGRSTQATAQNAMATGHSTVAGHTSSFAGGESTQTSKDNQTVVGQYNADDSDALFIVGDGTANNARSNCFEAGKDGNGKFIKVGNTKFNENEIAKKSNIPTSINGLDGGTLTSPLNITGGDSGSSAKIALSNAGSGQITDESTHTLFGFTSDYDDTLTMGHNSYKTNIRGSGTRPTYKGNDMALYSDVTEINNKIPAQASSSNQLADKDFVNSSIATNTATFRGTYNVVSDLNLTIEATENQIAAAIVTKLSSLSITPDNNDYCFIQIPTADATPNQILQVQRFKYNGTTWSFEYALNNSGFTANQWATINSSLTSADKTKLDGIESGAQVNTIASISAGSTALTPDANKNVNIPIASANDFGVLKVKTYSQSGLLMEGGFLYTYPASTTQINSKSNTKCQLTPNNIDLITKVGVTTNTETLTDTEKANAQTWLGLNTLTGSTAPTTSTVGRVGQLYLDTTNNITYQCTAKTTESDVTTYTWKPLDEIKSISAGGTTLTIDNNKNINIPIAADNTYGVIRQLAQGISGIGFYQGGIYLQGAGDDGIANRSSQYGGGYGGITPANLNKAVKAALTDSNHLTMTSAEQATAKSVLGVATIKTIMDNVAEVNTEYYLGTQTTVAITVPSTASAGDRFTVDFASGSTATTLTITGSNVVGDTSFVPEANKLIEMNFKYDGTYWKMLISSLDIPSEV